MCRKSSTSSKSTAGGGGGGGGALQTGGLFNLAKKVVSSLQKELECKLEKLRQKKVKVMQLRFKNKSQLPELDQSTRSCTLATDS